MASPLRPIPAGPPRGIPQTTTIAGRPKNAPQIKGNGGLDPDADPPMRGMVRFITAGVPKKDRVSLDVQTFAEPTLPEAESGWDVVEIPQSVDLPVWRSGKPLRMTIPIIMDVLGETRPDGEPRDIEDEWLQLVHLWRPPAGAQPPQVRVYGPVTFADRRWVISDLRENPEFTKRLYKQVKGDKDRDRVARLVRVQADVVLLATRSPDLVDFARRRDNRRARKDRTKFIASKSGDTLKKIAKRELGNGRRAHDLLKLNPGVGSVNRTIPSNTEIRIK